MIHFIVTSSHARLHSPPSLACVRPPSFGNSFYFRLHDARQLAAIASLRTAIRTLLLAIHATHRQYTALQSPWGMPSARRYPALPPRTRGVSPLRRPLGRSAVRRVPPTFVRASPTSPTYVATQPRAERLPRQNVSRRTGTSMSCFLEPPSSTTCG